jgi:ABC-2 type transport system ATP-binding protein
MVDRADGGRTAVEVDGLTKRYGTVEALRGVSFTVAAGEVFALLGPNGAGKTTTVEILEGFRRRDGGTVAVLGTDPAGRPRSLRQRLGIVLQECAVESNLTVREVLTRNAGFYPDPRPVDEVIELVGLGEKADSRVARLSGGQQRRLDVGLGIIGRPELIFLDEPTTGFDPSARRGAWELVRSLTAGGTTVILTTHYMDEAEALADRVAVVAAGRIVAEGPPSSLGGRDVGEAKIRFALPRDVAAEDLPVQVRRASVGFELSTTDEVEVLHALTSWSIAHDIPLVGLTVERLTLEDVYLRLTADKGAVRSTDAGTDTGPGEAAAGPGRRPRRAAGRQS